MFDFFIDGFGLSRQRWLHRVGVALTTFVPMLFSVYLPGGFFLALQYAAVFAAVLVLILPSLMSVVVRRNPAFSPFCQQPGGNMLRVAIFLAGCWVLINFILINLHVLPT